MKQNLNHDPWGPPRVFTVAGNCCRQRFLAQAVHASSHPWQLVAYAALGLGRDGANNLASSRFESWAVDVRVRKKRRNP